MAASTSDKFKKTGASTVTTLAAPGKALAATSITVGSTTNYPTDTGIVVAIRQVDSEGELVAGTYTEWSATVTSGTTLAIVATPVYGSDQVYPAGSTTQVFIPVSSYAHNQMVDGLSQEHKQTGAHGDVTADSVSVENNIDMVDGKAIRDGNDNELIKFSQTASAVNELSVKNSATGNAPEIQATGNDTNISIKLVPKGTGRVELNGAGAPVADYISTSQTTTSTSYTDLSTAGPAVTAVIGASGMALLSVTARASNNTSNAGSFMGVAISGANTEAADDERALTCTSPNSGNAYASTYTRLLTGLTPGSTTFTSKYKVSSGTGTFLYRRISVVPL